MKLVKYVNLVANKLDSLFDILTLWDTVIIIIIIITIIIIIIIINIIT